MKVYIKCPICLGSGKIKRMFGTRNSYSLEFKEKAVALYRSGISLREIAKKLGLKHPQSVQSLVDSYVKMVKCGEIKRSKGKN